jgi:hypothetical protein
MAITNAIPTVRFVTKPTCLEFLCKTPPRWWGVNTSFALMARREAGALS